jgi:DNA helicase II / ATP-dependent DNA helicase PcrA
VTEFSQIPEWVTENLNDEQKAALSASRESNHLVLAGAGSGKTRVLTRMVAAELLLGIDPSQLVVFTFTEKAADELVARLHSILTGQLSNIDTSGMFVGTIHSWCLKHLEQNPDFIGYTPIDELHTDSLVSRLYDDLALDTVYGLTFPKGIGNFVSDLEIFYNDSIDLDHVPEKIRSTIGMFVKILDDEKLLTFGEMIRRATTSLLDMSSGTSMTVFVDEFQDINPSQAKLLDAMTTAGGRIIAVGDEMQSIYNWRGSDVTRILEFANTHKPAEVTRLQTNYRSKPEIVELSQTIVSSTVLRDPEKSIIPGRTESDGLSVQHVSVAGQDAQAIAVVDVIERLHAGGQRWNQIAVLLRSVVSSGPKIVEEMIRRDIPVICPILGRSSEIVNELLIPLLDWIARSGDPINTELEEQELKQRTDSLLKQARHWGTTALSQEELWAGIDPWVDAIESGSDDAYNIRSLVYDAFDKFGVRVDEKNPDVLLGLSIASQVIRSVEEIHRRRMRNYQRRSARASVKEALFGLHRHMARFGESMPISLVDDAVAVITIHQAKGLEWSSVIVPQLLERRFPVLSGGLRTSFPDAIAGRYKTSEDDERRLFYVAATRAMDRLFLIDPALVEPERRSRFLRELQIETGFAQTVGDLDDDVFTFRSSQEVTDVPPVRVGVSDLLLYMECPFSFALRRMAGLQPSVGDELGFGQSLHELIQQRFLHGKNWSNNELLDMVDESVRLPYMSATRETNSKQAIANRIEALQNLNVFDSDLSSEIEISLTLENGTVNGIVDGLENLDNGDRRVRDWKSNVHEQFLLRYQRQLQFYALAISNDGKPVKIAELVDVSRSLKKRSLETIEVDVGPTAVAKFEQELTASLIGIQSGLFNATPTSESCESCDMYRLCGERIER